MQSPAGIAISAVQAAHARARSRIGRQIVSDGMSVGDSSDARAASIAAVAIPTIRIANPADHSAPCSRSGRNG
jgi:hypothetical protein